MIYSIIKPLLFSLDAETAHEVTLKSLSKLYPLLPKPSSGEAKTVMGIPFKNPVGLAAGLDKNADYIDALAQLGFGFIEVGTVTPKAQQGNPKPRLFRVKEHESIINRMGFNNKGVDYLLQQVSERKSDVVLGINIGKNLTTSVEHALDDYVIGLQKVYQAADYITINISSPNTPGLRSLQSEEALEHLLKGVHEQRQALADKYAKRTPIVLKIAPDLSDDALQPIADLLAHYEIDGLIATNTTLDREPIKQHPLAEQAGGLSGRAMRLKSRQFLAKLMQHIPKEIAVISAGGIDSVAEAEQRIQLGAQLIQVYSALIYKGPALVNQLVKQLK